MTVAVNEITTVVEQLSERVRMLESRISVLEGRPQEQDRPQPLIPATPAKPRPPETWQGFPSIELPGVVTTLGKAVLGIAGAYLLRAIAESGSVPRIPVLIVAIIYAGLWMVWAVRNHDDRFASVTYGITSTLILSPMLWESTVRFQFLTPLFSGVTLVAFFTLTMALTWRRDLKVIPWISSVATMFTAVALIVATHDLVPLTVAILGVALAVEMGVCFGHLVSVRLVPAVAADIAIWLVVYLMTSPIGVPEGYRAIAPSTVIAMWSVLMVIYVGSIGVRSFWMKQRITNVDFLQGAIAFTIAGFGALRSPLGSTALVLGAYFLLLSAGCYWGALSRFVEEPNARNRRISATWAAALLIASSFLLFPANVQVPLMCIAAVASTLVYSRTNRTSLGLHASLFLAAGAAVSSLPSYVLNALAGTVPSSLDWAVLLMTATATLCYYIGSRMPEMQLRRRTLWVFPAVLLSFSGTALAVVAIVALTSGHMDLSLSRLSVIRTVVNCALALGMAFAGLRWNRTELSWVAYVAVAFGTLKLLFEDLRFGNAASLVVSLLFYGVILIVLPRLARRKRETPVSA